MRERLKLTLLVLLVATLWSCAAGPKTGSFSPSFDAVDTPGGPASSKDFEGKTVVYYFWATWCAPCVTSSPAMQRTHERYAGNDRVQVLGVHYDNRGTPREYVAQYGYTFLLVPDGGAIVKAFGVKKIPQIVVVSPSGEIVHSQIGFAAGDDEKVVAAIEGTF